MPDLKQVSPYYSEETLEVLQAAMEYLSTEGCVAMGIVMVTPAGDVMTAHSVEHHEMSYRGGIEELRRRIEECIG